MNPNRLLITADWHIADYPQYNAEPGSRLSQFEALAHRIVAMAREHDCGTLVIAGDFVDVPTLKPKVLHMVSKCIKILKEGFERIWFILGQHDLDTKGEQSEEDTVMTLFKDASFEYVDRQVKEVGNVLIGFANFTEEQDLSWLARPVDVMIGHLTKIQGMDAFSQHVDESKFKDFIHGDIHDDKVILKDNGDGGRYISISNPIQKDRSSIGNGSVIIYDTVEPSWERVEVDPDHSRFLRIEDVNDDSKKGWSEDKLTFYYYAPKIERSVSEIVTDESGNVVDGASPIELPERVQNVFADAVEIIEKEGLGDIHKTIGANIVEPEGIDFDFQLNRLYVKNFRSIAEATWNFSHGDRIVVMGANGSGKSSLLEALCKVFEKDVHIKDEMRKGEKDMVIEAELSYQGNTYKITRGSKYGLAINGIEQKYNNKNDFDKDITVHLPFAEWTSLMFIHAGSSDVTSQLGPSDKVELLARFFHLDKFQGYSDKAEEAVKERKAAVALKEKELAALQGAVESKSADIKAEEEKLASVDKVRVMEELTALKDKSKKADAYNTWQGRLKPMEDGVTYAQAKIEASVADIAQKEQECASLDLASVEAKIVEANGLLAKLQMEETEMTTTYSQYNKLKSDVDIALSEGKSIKAQIESLEKSGYCPVCKQKLPEDGHRTELLNQLRQSREEALVKYNEAKAALDAASGLVGGCEADFTTKMAELKQRVQKGYSYKSGLMATKQAGEAKMRGLAAAKASLSSLEAELGKKKAELETMKANAPEPCVFSAEDRESMFMLQLTYERFGRLEKAKEELAAKMAEVRETTELLGTMNAELDDYKRYAELVSPSGQVYKTAMAAIARQFSDERYRYSVETGVFRGKAYCRFNVDLFSCGDYYAYDSLSTGQKALADLDFLSKLFVTRLGLFVLDEYIKHFDEENSVEAAKMLSELNCNVLLASSLETNFPMPHARYIHVVRDEDGKSIYLCNR